MKKVIYISCLLLFMSTSVNAQLTMNLDKKVSIGTDTEEFEAQLLTGGLLPLHPIIEIVPFS